MRWLRFLRFELSSRNGPLSVRPSGGRLLAYLAVLSERVPRQEALRADCR